nr:hypothetical protein [Tanacetum cinerariifolium]
MEVNREELSCVPVWVKFLDVLLVAYTSDGLRLIAMKIGTPMIDNLVMDILNFEGTGYTKETILIEYEWEPPRCSTCLLYGHLLDDCPKAPKRVENRMDKGKCQTVGADDEAKQSAEGMNNSPKTSPFIGTNKALTSCYIKIAPSHQAVKATTSGIQEERQSSTLVEMISVFEQQILEGKFVLVDDGKPFEKVDYLDYMDNEDEVEPIDNETTII